MTSHQKSIDKTYNGDYQDFDMPYYDNSQVEYRIPVVERSFVYLEASIQVELGDLQSLNPTYNKDYRSDYFWHPADGIACATCSNTEP